MSDLSDIHAAIQRNGGNVTAAARELGIPRTTLRCRMRERTEVKPRRHLVIPDGQVRQGVSLDHWTWIGKYIADKRPDVIINLGDFADMPSLSAHEKVGSQYFEGKRYKKDVEAVHLAMEMLCSEFSGIEGYSPEMILTLGNHEDRITRCLNAIPMLEGTISLNDLGYEAWGWKVIPYRQPVKVDGVSYCHYYYNPNTGKPYGGVSHTMLKNVGMTFTQGHRQGKDLAERELSDGSMQRGLIVGSCYQHNEDYKGPQSNHHWRGIIMKHEVMNGHYDLMEVSLNYLKRRYGG